ncbi:MAG: hypothetical protein ACYS0E_09655 [Planctomycetota bacterium]
MRAGGDGPGAFGAADLRATRERRPEPIIEVLETDQVALSLLGR